MSASTTTANRPTVKPQNPNFSSGPCAKHPGWSLASLPTQTLGRSHRAKIGKDKLKKAIEDTKTLLELPQDYLVGIVAGSDTGAVEMALWSLLGPRPVDVFAWEAFGKDWVTDVVKQLKLDHKSYVADYGQLPDFSAANFEHDVVFTWNGTTSGARVPNGNWIPDNRQGLTICDATSAVFAMDMPWSKLDVVTFSWQKVLGGEAAHGILILSPRAVARLESYKPTWPMPKTFRMTKDGKLNKGIFEGETINTPSMLCVEDAIEAMAWVKSIGGLKGTMARSEANFKVLADWVEKTPWIGFLAEKPEARSNTSVCLKFTDPAVANLSADEQAAFTKKLVAMIEAEGAGYDFANYRDAPAGLRIWCGATIEPEDVRILTQWIEWAFAQQKATLKAAA